MDTALQHLRSSFAGHPYLPDLSGKLTDWMTFFGDYEVNRHSDRSEAWFSLDNRPNIEKISVGNGIIKIKSFRLYHR